ncbi:MAG: 1-acyl-sn-glycerol-3-phosphate acyltransferase [Bacteroidia bacterium]|nr:1-acyl-sn-glycerol-3-phosphate acyltransferase [Bacteroidia bacterium]
MILLTSIGIALVLLLSLLTFNRQLPLKVARTIWSPMILKICGIKIEIQGKDSIDLNKPSIFVSNHLSFIDIPCLFYALPKNLHFIAKESLKSVPFLGWFMMATGMIFVDRSNLQKSIASLKKAAKLVSKDKNVLVFPEGSRSKDGRVKIFKKGAFHLAVQAGATLIPIGIKGTDKIWGTDSYKLTSGTVSLKIGQGIDTSKLKDPDVNALIKQVRETVIKLSA